MSKIISDNGLRTSSWISLFKGLAPKTGSNPFSIKNSRASSLKPIRIPLELILLF